VETKTSEVIEVTASPEQTQLRLDRALSALPQVRSRSRAQKLMELGLVAVNGKPQKASYLVQAGDRLRVEIPVESNELIPLKAELDVIYEDDDLAVIHKPSGLVVHPAEGHAQDTLVNILLDKIPNLSMGFNEKRPGIVHRLDKETSGLLVVAKNDFSHTALSEQFRARTVKREYYALVFGKPKALKGRVETKLGRDPRHRKRFKSVTGEGKTAITNYEHFRTYIQGITELRVRLETGRTHQIRVHLSEMSHPIIGDSLYGADARVKQLKSKTLKKEILSLKRIALHAAVLGFAHPRSGEELFFQSGWPEDMKTLLDLLC
jgi:23S rRNA pseudouridine1911/1915/1917 synthase